jgi:hypothetical protein
VLHSLGTDNLNARQYCVKDSYMSAFLLSRQIAKKEGKKVSGKRFFAEKGQYY